MKIYQVTRTDWKNIKHGDYIHVICLAKDRFSALDLELALNNPKRWTMDKGSLDIRELGTPSEDLSLRYNLNNLIGEKFIICTVPYVDYRLDSKEGNKDDI